ncbi:hypothetical protein H5410_051164 [Solanum commersonii]|uniref:Uncharacterized protein n=1 Tax=Solanum commersonii TaxID=4109 RepID=A0A9J5WXG5_SOLCO|nr:hypothetical protein H5410_051164 [Solanum commersonii]
MSPSGCPNVKQQPILHARHLQQCIWPTNVSQPLTAQNSSGRHHSAQCPICSQIPLNGASESGCIGSIELPHNLLTVRPWFSSHPVTLVKTEQPVNAWNRVQAPRENSPLFCDQSGHFLFVIYHLSIPVNLPLALDTPPIWFAGYRSGSIIWWYGYRLRTSSLIR